MDVAIDGITVENDSPKSVLKCNVLHQIQYHACEPVWYWGILDQKAEAPTTGPLVYYPDPPSLTIFVNIFR